MANEFIAKKGLITQGGFSTPYTSVTANYTATTTDYTIDVN